MGLIDSPRSTKYNDLFEQGVDPSVLSSKFKKVMGIQYRLNEFDFMDVSKTRMLESDKVLSMTWHHTKISDP